MKLLEFFSSHTADTIYSRYGCFVGMSPEPAVQLVSVNQSRDCALGVFGRRSGALIAIGRYCLDATGDSAEVAFVVRENRRGLGVATALLRKLRLRSTISARPHPARKHRCSARRAAAQGK